MPCPGIGSHCFLHCKAGDEGECGLALQLKSSHTANDLVVGRVYSGSFMTIRRV